MLTVLTVQAIVTARLSLNPRRTDARVLAALETVMVGGYLGERLVRHRLRPGSWNAAETPVAAAGLSLAAVMSMLGWRVVVSDGDAVCGRTESRILP